ncbi:MAG: hypothetical protein NWF00_09410 [Candidatus Bathyarchaeota archaeon]|nr:hypothetical protein [Candidatus Bathyarchaeota archaeon]
MGKRDLADHRPFGFGNTSRRFPQYITKREKGKVAKDRFAFEQAMQGNDCTKIRKGGDFIVQKRDFFGNKIGNPMVYDVKTGNAKVTAEQEKRKRQLGRDRHKIVRY